MINEGKSSYEAILGVHVGPSNLVVTVLMLGHVQANATSNIIVLFWFAILYHSVLTN